MSAHVRKIDGADIGAPSPRFVRSFRNGQVPSTVQSRHRRRMLAGASVVLLAGVGVLSGCTRAGSASGDTEGTGVSATAAAPVSTPAPETTVTNSTPPQTAPVTLPATSAVTQPPTTPATQAPTTTVTQAPTTTSAPASTTPSRPAASDRPIALADWPASSVTEVPLAELPYLVLDLASGSSRAVRTESTEVFGLDEATSIWVSSSGPGWLMVSTFRDPSLIVSMNDAEPINDAVLASQGWTTQRRWIGQSEVGPVLDLADANGVVRLRSFGYAEDELLKIARGMIRKPLPEAGWELTDTSEPMELVIASNERSQTTRSVVYFDQEQMPAAQLIVSTADSMSAQRGWWDGSVTRQLADLTPSIDGGQPVVAQITTSAEGDRIEFVWKQNKYLVMLVVVGMTTEEATATANSVAEVTPERWLESTVEPDPDDDGCPDLFC